MLRVTLDTSAVGPSERTRIEAVCRCRDVDLANTTVTDRELEGTSIPSKVGAFEHGGVLFVRPALVTTLAVS
jgi:hypothetical protein